MSENNILKVITASLISLIISLSSIQSPLVTLYSNPNIEQHWSAIISLVSIGIHFLITVLAYLMDPKDAIDNTKQISPIFQEPLLSKEPLLELNSQV
jgi:hypothetical protein